MGDSVRNYHTFFRLNALGVLDVMMNVKMN